MKFAPEELLNTLRGHPAARRYWVGFSGGLDSTVLLQSMARIRGQLGAELRAIHINHHIHADSDAWQAHCLQVCAELDVACEVCGVAVNPIRGESLEAVARQQRYAAWRELLRVGDVLLLAQHQDDQLETFLLQALRGAGVRGLAAMPEVAHFGAGQLARPLLGFTREALRVWAQAQGLDWLEDPSNVDTRFNRNYLRGRVIPLLRARWPAAAATVSRSAHHCSEALELLAASAEQDLQQFADSQAGSLRIAPLLELGIPRSRNLLRAWFVRLRLPPPSARKLEQIFAEVARARADRNPCVAWTGAEVRRYRGRIYALPPLPDAPRDECRLRPGIKLNLGPVLGSLSLQAATGEGLRAAVCPAEGFAVRFRAGGEACQPAGRAYRRPLKKWLQEYGVVPWMRVRLPLIYAGADLVAVAGLFTCAQFAVAAGEPGLRIQWRMHPSLREELHTDGGAR